MFDLESNVGEKVSQTKRAGRLKENSAYNNESSEIDLRYSVAEDAGVTAGKIFSQAIIPANEDFFDILESAKGIQR